MDETRKPTPGAAESLLGSLWRLGYRASLAVIGALIAQPVLDFTQEPKKKKGGMCGAGFDGAGADSVVS